MTIEQLIALGALMLVALLAGVWIGWECWALPMRKRIAKAALLIKAYEGHTEHVGVAAACKKWLDA